MLMAIDGKVVPDLCLPSKVGMGEVTNDSEAQSDALESQNEFRSVHIGLQADRAELAQHDGDAAKLFL